MASQEEVDFYFLKNEYSQKARREYDKREEHNVKL
jgi:hypothetical protein